MSNQSEKKKVKTSTPSEESPPATSSVREAAAQASHLHEVVAIIRAASAEYINRFAPVGFDLPELLLEGDGSGARSATIEALVDAGVALEGIARELEARALALLSLRVESAETIHHVHTVSLVGGDRVVHRDHLERALRPKANEKNSASRK